MINKKLGYYTVDQLEFDSKIQACLYANKTNQEVKWHFNEKIFESYNWSVEPELTLDQLYDRRTRQLREEYDYIIVSYSAGADSHNIIESFLRQGLHIDELIINTMEKGSSKTTVIDPNVKNAENAASEHYLQTLPRLKEIQNRAPKTKITILDLTDYLLESWLSIGDARWVMDKREGLNPLNVTRFNYIHFSDVRKQFDKDKKIGLILGVEKPRTFIHSNNKFYIRFTDRATNIITIAEHIEEYTNSVVEYFYWSPDSCDILCKQAHVIKKWLEANPQYQHLWFHKNMTADTFRLIHERMLRTLVYTTWDDNWFQSNKATKDWYSEFDSWFIEGHKGSRQHDIWLEGINYVRDHATNFINREHGYDDGLKIFAYNFPVGEMAPGSYPSKIRQTLSNENNRT
jgi:hypothetical protein